MAARGLAGTYDFHPSVRGNPRANTRVRPYRLRAPVRGEHVKTFSFMVASALGRGKRGEIVMLVKKRQFTITKVLMVALLVLGLSLLTGCNQEKQESGQLESTTGFLTITGNGVEKQTKINLSDLKDMKKATVGECYSVVNNWPSKKFAVGKGVKITHLLEKAGIKNDAQTIIVWAGDGYNATFTREQLEEKRFYFPNLLNDSKAGAKEVPAILAWEHREGTNDLSKATGGDLCLLLGQKGLNDAVAPVLVKDVVTLEVLTTPGEQWSVVQAQPAPGKVKAGTKVVLEHPQQDAVKIYYTLDGSIPDENSSVYNPSTTYFQPDLTKPIEVNESVTINTVVVGFGKNKSPVATFTYEVE